MDSADSTRGLASHPSPGDAKRDDDISGSESVPTPTPVGQRPPRERVQPLDLPLAGSFLGKYQIIRPLGAGGMGSVMLARDTRLGRLVALEFLTDYRPALTRRLLAEAQATARCQHENIVIIYEVAEQEPLPYLVLEHVKGQTLREHMRERSGPGGMQPFGLAIYTPLPPRRAVEIMVPVVRALVRALVRAHSMGIIHRDLKPENIMLTESGGVKVLDFGLAQPLADELQRETSAPALDSGASCS